MGKITKQHGDGEETAGEKKRRQWRRRLKPAELNELCERTQRIYKSW